MAKLIFLLNKFICKIYLIEMIYYLQTFNDILLNSRQARLPVTKTLLEIYEGHTMTVQK